MDQIEVLPDLEDDGDPFNDAADCVVSLQTNLAAQYTRNGPLRGVVHNECLVAAFTAYDAIHGVSYPDSEQKQFIKVPSEP